jgi:hypothetical protein
MMPSGMLEMSGNSLRSHPDLHDGNPWGEKPMTTTWRYATTGRPVFITAVCYRRRLHPKTDERKDLLLSVMREVKNTSGFVMPAYVILDDHF